MSLKGALKRRSLAGYTKWRAELDQGLQEEVGVWVMCVNRMFALVMEECVARETEAEKAAEAGLWTLQCKCRIWNLFHLQLRTVGT